jgi:imidazolonepropionase-like amidohydrolase
MKELWLTRVARSATAWAAVAILLSVSGGQGAWAQDLRITHVTVVSPERAEAMRDATVSIHAGRIAAITTGSRAEAAAGSSGAAVVDGRGLYLAPGLIDSHVHLGGIPGMSDEQERQHPDIARAAREQIPRSFLQFGYTTIIDLISTPQAMALWKAHALVPDTYFCGGAALLDGYPMNFVPKPARYTVMPYMLVEPGAPLPAGVDPAAHTPEAVVARMKADGAICVKTFFERGYGAAHDLPVPQLATIRAVVRAAHAAGLPVLMHANAAEAQRYALDAGVDIIAHGLWRWDEPLPASGLAPGAQSILDRVIATNTGWQPTIQVLAGLRDLFQGDYLDDPMLSRVLPASLISWYRSPEGQQFHDVIAQDFGARDASQLQARTAQVFGGLIVNVERATGYLGAHDGRLLFGTDTPSGPTYANPPGLNGFREMHNLIEARLSPAQIFRMATLANARALHLEREVGTVQVGKRANLLLLHQDPTRSIEAYGDIDRVILGGRLIDPAQLRPPVSQASH